jgi:hypothetical protein
MGLDVRQDCLKIFHRAILQHNLANFKRYTLHRLIYGAKFAQGRRSAFIKWRRRFQNGCGTSRDRRRVSKDGCDVFKERYGISKDGCRTSKSGYGTFKDECGNAKPGCGGVKFKFGNVKPRFDAFILLVVTDIFIGKVFKPVCENPKIMIWKHKEVQKWQIGYPQGNRI